MFERQVMRGLEKQKTRENKLNHAKRKGYMRIEASEARKARKRASIFKRAHSGRGGSRSRDPGGI